MAPPVRLTPLDGGTRLVSLLGLGFGDCGKGLFTDALCRHWQAHTVVRFNGGAQAGHNVVLPDGRHHTFAQFGAGTFVPGVATLLAYPVVVHPSALLVEHQYLQRAGVDDALARLLVDGRCRVNTPFHQAAGRVRELRRGAQAHGSCGVGVGETVLHALTHPDQVLHYADLAHPGRALAKLRSLQHTLLQAVDGLPVPPGAAPELHLLRDVGVAQRWLAQTGELLRQVPPASADAIAQRLQQPGTVLFEGAQGVLLDEWHGLHPHTTWSSIQTASVEAVARDAGCRGRVHHLGVLRSYLTRHGPGPLPTEDPALNQLAEPHNSAGGWQGAFRRGHPDAVLLRYALAVVGRLDGLLVSHLDAFERSARLQWCNAYQLLDRHDATGVCLRDPAHAERITALRASAGHDLQHQAALTQLLQKALPLYEPEPIGTVPALLEKIETLSGLAVLFGSFGATHSTVRAMTPHAFGR